MRSEPIAPLYVFTFLLGIIFASLFALSGRQHELSKVETRCLAYFRDTFHGYDTAPEVCEHIVSGKPIAPYQFGQESSARP